MSPRKLLIYYAWSRPAETHAPLEIIENRFPTLFESRRLGYPRFEEFTDPDKYDQSIGGFLDHIMKRNFADLAALAGTITGEPAIEIERVTESGERVPLDAALLNGFDTVVIISFDSFRTDQKADPLEIEAVRTALSRPDQMIAVCPHHDIGDEPELPHDELVRRQVAHFLHHGDRSIPPRQQFGGFARSLLAGLGVPVENRFGLRPAALADGSPAPIEAEHALDRLGLLAGVPTFNLHPHLPHFERLGPAQAAFDVLARQKIDLAAPPHPFTAQRDTFDALLQSRDGAFGGTLLVGDATLWSSTAGGVESLRRFWSNVLRRPGRA